MVMDTHSSSGQEDENGQESLFIETIIKRS